MTGLPNIASKSLDLLAPLWTLSVLIAFLDSVVYVFSSADCLPAQATWGSQQPISRANQELALLIIALHSAGGSFEGWRLHGHMATTNKHNLAKCQRSEVTEDLL